MLICFILGVMPLASGFSLLASSQQPEASGQRAVMNSTDLKYATGLL
jgi:hypothetical protein